MCLAEALLRIPDAETVDRLIRDKIAAADWQRHLGHSGSLFVNASTWALMLTGRLLRPDRIGPGEGDLGAVLRRFVARSSEPVWRQAVTAAMRILAGQFVMGRTIDEALERAREAERHGYRHSFDMLGEAARTMADAERYRAAYEGAIAAIGKAAAGRTHRGGPRHLGQAVGAAPALRDGAARTRRCANCCRRCSRSPAGARRRHRLHDRRRGGRPARTVARPYRGAGARPGARRLGRARPRGAGLSEAGAAADRLARRSGPAGATAG